MNPSSSPLPADPAPPEAAPEPRLDLSGWRYAHVVTAISILGLDLWTKRLAEEILPSRGGSVSLVDGFLSLALVHNTGAAFGLFSQTDPRVTARILNVVAIVALAVVGTVWFRTPNHHKRLGFGLALVFAGALGNLVDRFTLGYVVDFIEVYWRSFHWPNFNVADSSISIGVGLLILDSFAEAAAPSGAPPRSDREKP
jgi:signal peptidase II